MWIAYLFRIAPPPPVCMYMGVIYDIIVCYGINYYYRVQDTPSPPFLCMYMGDAYVILVTVYYFKDQDLIMYGT